MKCIGKCFLCHHPVSSGILSVLSFEKTKPRNDGVIGPTSCKLYMEEEPGFKARINICCIHGRVIN